MPVHRCRSIRRLLLNGIGASFAVLAVSLSASHAPAVHDALAGAWDADLSHSKLRPRYPIRRASLDIVVDGDVVRITDDVTMTSGERVRHEGTVFEVDGREHPHEELAPGLVVTAVWRGSRILETTLKWAGQIDHITYELSEDGTTLTNRVLGNLGEQVLVFSRR